ncbi:MAG: phage head morphogenesis protein, partial [Clostridia bacterium]|nr:phage head morphogenesis protein [Clostridia bacterium]
MPSNPKDKLNSKKFRKIMANASYWSKIMQNLTDIEVEATEKEINSIEQIYKTAQSNISKDITYWYNKFAGNNVLSFADAQKLLNKDELEEFHWTVDEYINHGQENIDGAWEKQLINASSKVHIKRMDALNMQLENAIQQLYASNEKHLDGLLMSVYDDAYYRSIYEVKKGMNIGASFNQLDHHVINKAINKPWSIDGQTWSERLWGNRETIINKMKTDFTQGIIRGESLDKLTKKLSDDV